MSEIPATNIIKGCEELQAKLLDPKLDIVFKKLFCMPDNVQALLRFINLIFADRGMPLIEEIEIINPHLDGDLVHEKFIVLDIHAKTTTGERINIEIQLRNHAAFRERMLFYWSRPYSSQLRAGQFYTELKRTVSIFLLDFCLTELDDPHSIYQVLEIESHEPLTDQLEIHVIELPKLEKCESKGNRPLLNWLAFLNGAPQSEWAYLAAEDSELRKVMITLETMSNDLQLWALAEARKKAMHDQASLLDSAHTEGAEQARRQIATCMLSEGLAIELIAKVTGYSAEELVRIQQLDKK